MRRIDRVQSPSHRRVQRDARHAEQTLQVALQDEVKTPRVEREQGGEFLIQSTEFETSQWQLHTIP